MSNQERCDICDKEIENLSLQIKARTAGFGKFFGFYGPKQDICATCWVVLRKLLNHEDPKIVIEDIADIL